MRAYSKFSVRQKQQSDYKLDRLSKVIDDLRNELGHQKVYDKFLQEKMKNIKQEMERINDMVQQFEQTTLAG